MNIRKATEEDRGQIGKVLAFAFGDDWKKLTKDLNKVGEALACWIKIEGFFVAENENADGLCKLIIEKNSDRLIGVHLIGSYASEIIHGAAMMIESRWCADDLKEIVFPHPTVSEIIRETLFA